MRIVCRVIDLNLCELRFPVASADFAFAECLSGVLLNNACQCSDRTRKRTRGIDMPGKRTELYQARREKAEVAEQLLAIV